MQEINELINKVLSFERFLKRAKMVCSVNVRNVPNLG